MKGFTLLEQAIKKLYSIKCIYLRFHFSYIYDKYLKCSLYFCLSVDIENFRLLHYLDKISIDLQKVVVVTSIINNIIIANSRSFKVSFVWIPSHIGVVQHDDTNKAAKTECDKPEVEWDMGIPISSVKAAIF